jgi:peptide/nickel transport system substrate-binding protein
MKNLCSQWLFTILLIPALAVPAVSTDGSLIYLREIDASQLDPGKSSNLYSSEVIVNIFEGLVRHKEGSFDVEPCLASSWRMENGGRRWIFSLRKGVRFHNGQAFDSSSVVNTFTKRMEPGEAEPRKWWFFFPYLETIRALDPYTVEIVLSKPFAPMLQALTDPIASVVANQAYNRDGSFRPIGTGAFEFGSWEPGRQLILKRNDSYWGDSAPLSRVIYKVVTSPTAKITQLRNGLADLVRLNSASEYDQLLGKKEVEVLSVNTLQVYYLAFNTARPPFDRVEVREAFAHLINKVGMIRHIFQRLSAVAITPIPPSLFGFHQAIKDYAYNPERARRLFDQAGLGSGFNVRLYFVERDSGIQKIAGIIAGNAKQFGVNVTRVSLPFLELTARVDKGEHHMVLLGWSGLPDPDHFLFPTLTLERGHKNRAFYNNPHLTEILLRARFTLSRPERIKLYREAQEIIHADVPWIPLHYGRTMIAHRKNIRHLFVDPADRMIFRNTTKE